VLLEYSYSKENPSFFCAPPSLYDLEQIQVWASCITTRSDGDTPNVFLFSVNDQGLFITTCRSLKMSINLTLTICIPALLLTLVF
jgi:hypothetical protein